MKYTLILVLLTATALSLPYQAHGFNDLEYFLQLLRKGVKVFKLDLSMVVKDSCINHSTWNESINSCETFDEYAQDICCLGFRGDTSSTPNFNYDFNTSYEFVNVLKRADIRPLFKGDNIFIAINFQYHHSQNNLTKTFLYDMMKAIDTNKLNVTIATGTDNIILDYDFKCVTQGLCKNDSISKYISDSGIVLQSSSYDPYHPHDVYRRYRNFNVYYKQVEEFCSKGFPSWVDKYSYPLIFWEPSNEQQIQYVAKTFLSSQCKRPQKHNTVEHFVMASNLEPQMFQTYFQNYENDYGYGQKMLLVDTTNVLVTTITIGTKQHIISTWKSTQTPNITTIELIDTNGQDVLKSKNINYVVTALKGSQDRFAINAMNETGNYTFVYDSTLEIKLSWEQQPNTMAMGYSNGLVIYVKRVTDTYYNYVSTPDGRSAMITGCDLGFSPTDLTVIEGAAYVVGQLNGDVYLNYNCTQSRKIGFGRAAYITSHSASIPYLHIMLVDSMCQSAVFSNNNEMNKCTFYKEKEFEQLKTVPKMINYISGSVEDFKAVKDQNNPITACDGKFMAAKIANGERPSATVIGNQLLIAYSYVPLNRQPLITTLFCGASNYDNIQKGAHYIVSSISLYGIKQKQQAEIVA